MRQQTYKNLSLKHGQNRSTASRQGTTQEKFLKSSTQDTPLVLPDLPVIGEMCIDYVSEQDFNKATKEAA